MTNVIELEQLSVKFGKRPILKSLNCVLNGRAIGLDRTAQAVTLFAGLSVSRRCVVAVLFHVISAVMLLSAA